MPDAIEYTDEVEIALISVEGKIVSFKNSVINLKGKGGKEIRPGDFYDAFQLAIDCSDAMRVLSDSFNSEEAKHSTIKSEIEEKLHSAYASIEEAAAIRVSSVINTINQFGSLAKLTDQNIESVTKKPIEYFLSAASFNAESVVINFEKALSNAGEIGAEFNDNSFNKYSILACWGAVGTTILFWFSGLTSFGGSLVAGVIAGGVVFFRYLERRQVAAQSIRALVRSAYSEFSKIRKEKLQSEEVKKNDYLDNLMVEGNRFERIKENIQKYLQNNDVKLNTLLDDFIQILNSWVEENIDVIQPIAPIEGQKEIEINNEKSSVFYSRLGEVTGDIDYGLHNL